MQELLSIMTSYLFFLTIILLDGIIHFRKQRYNINL